jgi:hypothetical protein
VDILNKVLDFIISDQGQMVIGMVATLFLGSKWGKHFSTTPEQVEKTVKLLAHVKTKGETLDIDRASKSIQRELRNKLFGK